MAASNRAPIFFIGLFFGILVGWFASFAFSSHDVVAPDDEQAEPARDPHGGMGAQTPPRDDQPRNPHGAGGPAGAGRAQESIAKVHFMKKFVAALTDKPANALPNPRYVPLLKDPSNPLRCANCHDTSKVDIEKMKALDPGADAVEPLRRRPMFMIPLMHKWVDRLNEQNGALLIKKVTCTDCHAIAPDKKWDILPPLMIRFVNALRERPSNRNPAEGWKPLLKDPSNESMMCSVCHGETGKRMEERVPDFAKLPHPDSVASDKEVMIELMEHWVEELNHNAGPMLTKAVTCLDCHDTDPRR